jgi:hypothetical protein
MFYNFGRVYSAVSMNVKDSLERAQIERRELE